MELVITPVFCVSNLLITWLAVMEDSSTLDSVVADADVVVAELMLSVICICDAADADTAVADVKVEHVLFMLEVTIEDDDSDALAAATVDSCEQELTISVLQIVSVCPLVSTFL